MDETTYRARLDAQDWGDVRARLLDFAESRCGKNQEAQAKDLTQQAITRVYAHDSKWDPSSEPDLVRFLMSVVNGLLANERASYAAKKSASMDRKKTRLAAERVADTQAFSEEGAAEHDLLSRRLTLLRERTADDPDVHALLDRLERGDDAPDVLRAATGWSANKLLAVRRRMLRAAALVARDLGGTDDDDLGVPHDQDDEEEEVA